MPPSYIEKYVEGLANTHFNDVIANPQQSEDIKTLARVSKTREPALTGKDVMRLLKERAQQEQWQECTLLTKVSLVRRLFVDYDVRAPLSMANQKFSRVVGPRGNTRECEGTYLQKVQVFIAKNKAKAACLKKLQLFVSGSLKSKYKAWRLYKLRDYCFDVEEIDTLFTEMSVLPDFMGDIVADETARTKCARVSHANRVSKLENMHEFANGDAILERANDVLRHPHAASISRLTVALCIVSGRRMTEICNGRSTFAPIQVTNGTLFAGQLKKSDLGQFEYKIPLLVPYTIFDTALECLRDKQGDIQSMTNDAISARYQSNCRKELITHWPEFQKIHQTRAFYAFIVFKNFNVSSGMNRWSFPRVVMHVLGHNSLDVGLTYSSVEVQDLTPSSQKIRFIVRHQPS